MYALGQVSRQWLRLDEPAAPQLRGAALRENVVPGMETWDLEFRIRFYVGPIITEDWHDYAKSVMCVCVALLACWESSISIPR